MRIKKGVSILGLRPEMLLGLYIVDPIIESFKQETVITSCVDGTHMKGSRHYVGLAIDLRTWTLETPDECIRVMKEHLGEDFDVILESDHIHMEYDPK